MGFHKLVILVTIPTLFSCKTLFSKPPLLPSNYMKVPLVRQATSYSCGAAALTSILYYWQVFDDGESLLYEPLETNEKDGTEPQKIIDVAKTYKLEAFFKEKVNHDDLKKSLANNETVILDIQAWPEENEQRKAWKDIWEAGHYIVLVGMDKEYAYFMDPSVAGGYAFIPLKDLNERWHDYENRHGYVWKNYQLAIFIKGTKSLQTMPAPIMKIE